LYYSGVLLMSRSWKGIFFSFAVLGLAIGIGILVYHYYSYIFSRVVDGRVMDVKRINSEVEGFVVSMRSGNSQDILTARTDDPRWALVNPGQCAQAKFFPHPPWNLSDSGTFFRATLLLIKDCGSDAPPALPVAQDDLPKPADSSEPIPGAPDSANIPSGSQ
jgi:hypothetical protein